MQITRETVSKILGVDNKKIATFIKEGKLKVVKVGFGARKFYDRDEVLKLAKEISTPKEL